MTYKFRIISNESDDFLLDIAIDGSLSFFNLHQFIQKELGYDPLQLVSFFITDHEWNKELEITLVDMMAEGQDNIMEMEKSIISDYIASNKQRMLYLFDMFNERCFFMEVFDIDDESIAEPSVIKKEGLPPKQIEMDLLQLSGGTYEADEYELEEDLDEFYKYESDFNEDMDFNDIADDDYR